MAFGKVARRTVVSDVAVLLDSPEISALVAELDALRWTGRRGYGARTMLGACLIKAFYALPTWTMAAALIAEHPGLQDAIGGTPSVWACYRFSTKLRANRPALGACFDACAASLREEHADFGRDVAIDASDIPAWSNGHSRVSKDGPERERISDPDASWGHRSAVGSRGAGSYFGFKIHMAVCTTTGLPMAWRVETGKRNESLFVAPLLDAARERGFKPETCAMDRGYDHNRVYAECEEHGVEPVIPLRRSKSNQPALPLAVGGRMFPRIARHTDRFRALYRRRVAVESEFGLLKRDYAFAQIRVRGLERVRLHADLTILAQLGLALHRARALPLAA